LLARSLVAHSRSFELDFAQRLSGLAKAELSLQGARAALCSESLVIVVRPGRALPLVLEEPTLRQQLKRWSALPARKAKDDAEPRPPIETDAGFGVGGILLAPASVAQGDAQRGRVRVRVLQLASADFDFGAPTMDLSAAEDLAAAVAPWLASAAAPALDAFGTIYLAVPWLAVCSAFATQMESTGARTVLAPDLMLGWQPSLTLVEMIAVATLPALMIFTGRYPTVHVVAIWP
jgi:hypothetical protein